MRIVAGNMSQSIENRRRDLKDSNAAVVLAIGSGSQSHTERGVVDRISEPKEFVGTVSLSRKSNHDDIAEFLFEVI